MRKHTRYLVAALIGVGLIGFMPGVAAAATGAKALFDSGEGSTVGMSVGQPPPAAHPAGKPTQVAHKAAVHAPEKYIGISYQMMVLGDDGRMTAVAKSRIFKTGERVKIIARTNRPGYLAVLNRGSSGLTHVLYHDYVDAYSMVEIPKNSNLRFIGAPGKEDVVLMLSDQPNPIALQAGMAAQGGVPAMPPPASSNTASVYGGQDQPAGNYNTGQGQASTGYGRAYSATPPMPTADSSGTGGYTPPPPVPGYPPPSASSGQSYGSTMMAQLDGAKGMRGAKDLVIEDGMSSSFAVVSPQQGYRPVQGGMKDLVLETRGGTHYGVVPTAAVANGGMLTLKMTLQHQ